MLGLTDFSVSMTHSRTDAMAFVVALKGTDQGMTHARKSKSSIAQRPCAFCRHGTKTRTNGGSSGLLIIGGAPGYIGAPALAAQAAGRSGAGIVNLAIPATSVGATATLVPEAVFLPLPDTESSQGARNALELLAPVAEKCQAIVVGPGLSRDDAASSLLAALFGDARRSTARSLGFGSMGRETAADAPDALVGKDKLAVVDADALHWLSERETWWTQVSPFSLVLTPHIGELAALTGRTSRRHSRGSIRIDR